MKPVLSILIVFLIGYVVMLVPIIAMGSFASAYSLLFIILIISFAILRIIVIEDAREREIIVEESVEPEWGPEYYYD